VTSKKAHEWLAIVIPSPLLFQSPAELESATGAKPRLLKPPSSVTRQFTSLLRRLLAEVEKRPELLAGTHAESCVQNEILQATKQLFNKGQESSSRHYGSWHDQTKAALEAKLSSPTQSMSLGDVARDLGVPERTLRSAFQKCYGLSPTECIRIYRLHQARQRLLTSDADQTTVTQVALDLGFWELGRFAVAYRKLFGERPSETLHRSPRAVQT
jgi:AraC-like DNA-binding protein